MSKIFVALILLIAANYAHAGGKVRCDPIDKNFRVSGPNLSISQMEDAGLRYAARNPKAPQVPFAYGNKRWRQLKELYRSGDTFRSFEQLWPPSGQPFAWGYALVRGQCILGSIETHVS